MRRFFLFTVILLMAASSCLAQSISFGRYEQDGNPDNGMEPLTWVVLEQDGDSLFLLCEYAVDCIQYNKKYNNSTTYENATVRAWLNEDFLSAAFTEEERTQIIKGMHENKAKKGYRSKGGQDTEDYVFLLSAQELEAYFPDKKDRTCQPTGYAVAKGVRVKRGNCPWWLRTPGREQHHASCVTIDGGYYDYFDISCPTNGIRPAIQIRVTEPGK